VKPKAGSDWVKARQVDQWSAPRIREEDLKQAYVPGMPLVVHMAGYGWPRQLHMVIPPAIERWAEMDEDEVAWRKALLTGQGDVAPSDWIEYVP
jgi:hypothetical protein